MERPSPSPRVALFESLAFGMFVHWGLYSQLGRGEWVQHAEKISTSEYLSLMTTFTAEDFDAKRLIATARSAGMRYVTLTARHHEGFSLYDTKGLSPWDVMHTPCGRDLILEFAETCRAAGIVPMLYHTTLDWNDQRFENDWNGYLQYLRDSIEVLCTNYGAIGGFWFDGNWSKPEADWQENQLYAVIRKHQPEAMIINNTGVDAVGRIGNNEIDCVTFERSRPEPMDRSRAEKYVASEMCHTMNFHWGTASKDFNLLSPAQVIDELCNARMAGSNLLMNIGPEAQGKVPEYEAAALAVVGNWVAMTGGDQGPIYGGRPAATGTEGDFGLQVGNDLFLFVRGLTAVGDTQYRGNTVRGSGPREFSGVGQSYSKAVWLDNGKPASFHQAGETVTLQAEDFPYGTNTVVRIAKLS